MSQIHSPPTHWDLSSLLSPSKHTLPYALLILNTPLNIPTLTHLLPHASLLICADAGADRYCTYQQTHKSSSRLPDAIIGDLDSLSASTKRHYASLSVPIIQDPSTSTTDFGKALTYIRQLWVLRHSPNGIENTNGTNGTNTANDKHDQDDENDQIDKNNTDRSLNIIAFGGLSGRVDQAMSVLHHIYLSETDERLTASAPPEKENGNGNGTEQLQKDEKKCVKPGRLYVLSRQSITFLLAEGSNVLHLGSPTSTDASIPTQSAPTNNGIEGTSSMNSRDSKLFDENIGILPLRGPATITTHGLEWDVTDWRTEFGGQVSTSNHIRSERVEIEVVEGERPLCTIELGEGFKMGES